MRYINRRSTKIAAALITVSYTLFYALMPIVLGNASDNRGLGEQEIGFLASLYMAGQAIGYFSGVFWIRRLPWRPLLVASGVMFSIGFFAASWLHQYALLASCLFVAGTAAAVGYGVTIACIGDTDEPERWFAWAWFMQAVAGTALAYLLPRLGTIGQDFDASMRLIAILVLMMMPLVLWLPNRGVKSGSSHPYSNHRVEFQTAALVLGMAVIVLVFIAESGLWSFLDRIAVAAGHDREFAGLVVALSFVGAGAGSSIAGILGTRFGRLLPMIASIGLSIGAASLFYLSDDQFSLLLAAFVYGFAWNLGAPYRMGLVAAADTTGRFVTMIPGMQAIGSVIGPGLAGMLIIDGSFALVYVVASGVWLLALALFVVANSRLKSSQQRQSDWQT